MSVSRRERFENIRGDAKLLERVLSVGVALDVSQKAVAPASDLGGRQRYVHAAVPSPPAPHTHYQYLLAEVAVRFGFHAHLLPGVLEVPVPSSNASVPVVDGAELGEC